jgi:hypothetical protein
MPASRLALLRFRDVVVTPYTDLLDDTFGGEHHRGGPRWPDWSNQTIARHCLQGRVPADAEPPDVDPTRTVTVPVAWGGAITGQFGHQAAEFSQRLLPTLAEAPEVTFAFASRDSKLPGARYLTPPVLSWDEAPTSFPAILDWFGIPRERVELVTEPTLMERLAVAPQAEQWLGRAPPSWYLDMLDAHTTIRLGDVRKEGSLYVSRAGQRARFAGEAYLEDALRSVGFRVLRPEDVPLEEQLRAYAGAETVVFAEGSAVHGPQLMGRALGDVTILTRRRRSLLAKPALKHRARSLRYVGAVLTQIQCLIIGGQTWPFAGLVLLDPEKLLLELPVGDAWDGDAFQAAVEADIEEWLKAQQQDPPSWAVFSRELAVESLRAAGMSHLERVL